MGWYCTKFIFCQLKIQDGHHHRANLAYGKNISKLFLSETTYLVVSKLGWHVP